MTRHSYSRVRGTARPTTTRWAKAILWCLVIFVITTYTLITTSGIDYPRIRVLHWVINSRMGMNGDNSQASQDRSGNLTWLQTQKNRVDHMVQACKSLNLTQTVDHAVMKHILVDKQHKVLMCFVPKVACTSWKRMWFWLAGLLEEDENIMDLTRIQVHGSYLPTLGSSKFLDRERTEMLATYKKFLFTRHPLDRLISAYRDKLENIDTESNFDFHRYVGQEIELMMRRKVSGGHNVSFQEFIRWVTPPNGTWTPAQRNEHWRPIMELCTPCAIQYDVIGRYENLETEANETLHWLGAGEYADRFPKPDRAFHANEQHHKYLSRLTSSDKLQFLRTYLLDFLLFGYDMP